MLLRIKFNDLKDFNDIFFDFVIYNGKERKKYIFFIKWYYFLLAVYELYNS